MEVASALAIKAAKKSLKKQESGELKLKDLCKLVLEKVGDDQVSSEQVKLWVQDSNKFVINGKKVSLRQKRSLSPKGADEELSKTAKKAKTEAKEDGNLTKDSATKWRTENKVVVMHATDDEEGKKITGQLNEMEIYFPFSSFNAPGCKQSIAPELLHQCTQVNGFPKPTPIQAQAWPFLAQKRNGSRRDVVGIAETGSGKTLSFSLVALSEMAKAKPRNNRRLPRMLVLSPTRELAMQSDEVLKEFGAVVGLSSAVVYGGVPKVAQVQELKRGVDCLVATPGRLKDLLQEGTCKLSEIDYLVLDEADRMLDMGFEEDVRYIISECKSKEEGRQTAMFSATWPAAIQKIALDYMVDPVRVYVGFESIVGSNGDNAVDDSLSANKRVTQNVEVIEDHKRMPRLEEILRKVHAKRDNRILIFALYKKEAERLEMSLQRSGWNCCSIHGNKNQGARTQALAEFKDGTCPLLVATDVAARGLDIPNVEVVINYTFPLTIEDYVHRIGRTGRAGKTGVSYTFFQPTDKSHAGELQQVIKQAGQRVPDELMKFGSTIKKKEHKLYGNFGPVGHNGPMKKASKIVFDSDGE